MPATQLVVQVLRTSVCEELATQECYCTLGCGKTRFATRVIKCEGQLQWNESFLFDIHDIKKCQQNSSDTAPDKLSLHVEIWVAKRWGSDANVLAADLPLGPLLPLVSSGDRKVHQNLAMQYVSRPASRSKTAPGSSDGASQLALVLYSVKRPTIEVPAGSLIPRAAELKQTAPVDLWTSFEKLTAPASANALECVPIVHTPQGHMYRAPAVQVLRVTLQHAEGLHNLHIDPQAAAAVGNKPGTYSLRLASVAHPLASAAAAAGESSSDFFKRTTENANQARAELLRRASEKAQEARASIREAAAGALRAKAGGWLQARRDARKAAAAADTAATGGAAVAAEGPARECSFADDASNLGSAMDRSGSASGSVADMSIAESQLEGPVGTDECSSSSSPRSFAFSRPHSRLSVEVGLPGMVTLDPWQVSAHQHLSPVVEGGSSGRSTPTYGRQQQQQQQGGGEPADWGSSSPSAMKEGQLGFADVPAAGGSPKQQQQQQGENGSLSSSWDGCSGDEGVQLATGSYAASEAGAGEGGSGSGVELRGSSGDRALLKQKKSHVRVSSIDADAVMAALENNGFHATDAVGGEFFYARISCGDESSTTRMVGLGRKGEAVWGQVVWFAVERPAATASKLDVELYSSRDKRARGRMVTRVEVPLHQLLSPLAASADSTPEHFKARHVLKGTFSANLHCTMTMDVEVVDTDYRAFHLPRAAPVAPPWDVPPSPSRAAAAAGESRSGTPVPLQRPVTPRSGVAFSIPLQSNFDSGAFGAIAKSADGSSPVPSPRAGAAAVKAGRGTAASAATAAAAAGEVEAQGAGGAGLEQGQNKAGTSAAAAGGSGSLAHLGPAFAHQFVLGALDIVVRGCELKRPIDVFFMLQMGPYWVVSHDSHSTQHPAWNWGLQLPVPDTDAVINLVLFRREGHSGGKKVVSVMSLLGDGVKSEGKIKIRLSSLLPNHPQLVTLPLEGDRANLRGGRVGASKLHLYLHLHVPQQLLLKGFLAHLFKVAMHPPLYLQLAEEQVPVVETVLAATQQVGTRWLEAAYPAVPAKVSRKVLDDGRNDFTLSRTRHNWRRLLALKEGWAPVAAAMGHVCRWENVWHSLGVYCVILLLGVYPSQVLAAFAVLLAAYLVSTARSIGWARLGSPPEMEPDEAVPEEQEAGVAVPTDPYTALKQNYDGVVTFLMTVQNVIDGWAAAGERLQLLLTWRDPLATALFVVVLTLLSLGLLLLGLRVLVTIGLLWAFRHPVLRNPYPPPPVAFVWRLPTRRDTTL